MEGLEKIKYHKQQMLKHIELPITYGDVKEFLVWDFINNFAADISDETKILINGRT